MRALTDDEIDQRYRMIRIATRKLIGGNRKVLPLFEDIVQEAMVLSLEDGWDGPFSFKIAQYRSVDAMRKLIGRREGKISMVLDSVPVVSQREWDDDPAMVVEDHQDVDRDLTVQWLLDEVMRQALCYEENQRKSEVILGIINGVMQKDFMPKYGVTEARISQYRSEFVDSLKERLGLSSLNDVL